MNYPANKKTVGFCLTKGTPKTAVTKLAGAYMLIPIDKIIVFSIAPYDVNNDAAMFGFVQNELKLVGAQIEYKQILAKDFDALADDAAMHNITINLP